MGQKKQPDKSDIKLYQILAVLYVDFYGIYSTMKYRLQIYEIVFDICKKKNIKKNVK